MSPRFFNSIRMSVSYSHEHKVDLFRGTKYSRNNRFELNFFTREVYICQSVRFMGLCGLTEAGPCEGFWKPA